MKSVRMELTSNNFHLINYFPEPSYWENNHDLFESKNVIIKASAKRIEYPRHWGVLSVKTVLHGRESYFVNDHQYKLDPNLYLILNHDQYYSSRIEENDAVESLSFHFTRLFEKTSMSYLHLSDEKLLDDPNITKENVDGFTVTQHSYSDKMKAVVTEIKHLLESVPEISLRVLRVEELYFDLYFEILRAQVGLIRSKENLKALKRSTRDEVFKRIILSKDYMESNYVNKTLSISELSKISCMNTFHFLRCFTQVYNKTPYQYLKELRLQRAFDLLKTKNYSVNKVLDLCGYQDASSFSKTFKAKYNIQPSKLS